MMNQTNTIIVKNYKKNSALININILLLRATNSLAFFKIIFLLVNVQELDSVREYLFR